MSKKLTGIIFTPEEFRKLNECLQCGKAQPIKKNKVCPDCKIKNLKKCELCEILLRPEDTNLFTYDTQEYFRDNLRFKPLVDSIREFTYITPKVESKDGLCSRCVDWETRMKKYCWVCNSYFENDKDHYKMHGNMCRYCASTFTRFNKIIKL